MRSIAFRVSPSGWAFIFDHEAGFYPYSLHLANGPRSVAQNVGVPLTSQNSNADSPAIIGDIIDRATPRMFTTDLAKRSRLGGCF
jgi:hypothetical protein